MNMVFVRRTSFLYNISLLVSLGFPCHSYDYVRVSEMNITGTLPQAGNLKLFVPSLSTQGSTRPKQNIFNILMRPDKTE